MTPGRPGRISVLISSLRFASYVGWQVAMSAFAAKRRTTGAMLVVMR